MNLEFVSKRYGIKLPDAIAAALERLAASEGNKPTTLASFLVERVIRTMLDEGKIPPEPNSISSPSSNSNSDHAVLDYLFGEASDESKRPTELQIVEFCSRRNLLVESVTKQIEAKAKEHR